MWSNYLTSNGIEIGIDIGLEFKINSIVTEKLTLNLFNSRLTELEEDSLKQLHRITLLCMETRWSKDLCFFVRQRRRALFMRLTEDGQVVLSQTFVFNPLTIGLHELLQIK